jgi:hypothetical protein
MSKNGFISFLKFLASVLMLGAFINPIYPGSMGTSQRGNIA